MTLDDARTFASRLLFRISHEPTQAARTLRAVLELHGPMADRTPTGEENGTPVVCGSCFPDAYPCVTIQTVALELAVPLPAERVYGVTIDG